jgi:glycosyltransferase involved in cell wall biosynthesis
VAGPVSVLVVSLATTSGWVVNEQELSAGLRRLEVEHDVRRVSLGPERLVRRSGLWPLVDAVEALGARRALAGGLRGEPPQAVILLATTTALLAPVRRLVAAGTPVAIRVDCPSASSRPGLQNAGQRLLERRRLAEATLVLATGPRSAALLQPLAARVAVLPVPVDAAPGPGRAGRDVLTYAADPVNKGLDLVCRAWWSLGPLTDGRLLHVTGVGAERGRRRLLREGIAEPPGLRWHGELDRAEHLGLLRDAAAYVSASEWEGTGIAQLESLAAGVPLVTTPSRGAYEAYELTRRLAPELAAPRRDADDLAAALGAAFGMDGESRRRYAEAAAAVAEPFSREAADRSLEREVLPVLLGG